MHQTTPCDAGFLPNGSINGRSAQCGSSFPSGPIAIVGMSCRFAGDVSSPSKLWDLIAAGEDGWSPIPSDRFNAKSLYHPNQQRTDRYHVQGGYFLGEDVTLFDAAFFSLSADAASAMDPQLRLSLEVVYEGIENGSGIPLEKLAGSNTSVFAGSFGRDYADRLMKDPEAIPASFITGNGTTMLSNRISHFYDLKGPSVTIDTGCSGSLAALHLAARSIQWGESDVSVVTASNTLLNPDFYIALSNLGVLSSEGKCYSWDHRGNGYGRGEGIATLVLKRLSDALKDGDFVHAVIRESAMNQDGKTGTITSPSMEAQQKLIEECYHHAGLNFSETSYVEAHMTGTAAGDPVEAEAIARTLGKSRTPRNALYVGSVKTNIGHTEPVSGLASIIKTALVLQKKLIPPNINYEKTNPMIQLKEWNLQVPTSLTPWPPGKPLRASVSNFGYGGTNVHVIMEASPSTTHQKVNGRVSSTNGTYITNGIKSGQALPPSVSHSYVYIVSSKDSMGTLAMNKKLAGYIQSMISNGHEPSPADLAYTLAERRSRFPWKTAFRARSLTELATRLEEPHRKPTRAMSDPPRIGFVFNGQGAQWYAMGRELISTYPVFESAIRQGDQIFRQDCGATWSLYDELLRDEKSSRIHEIDLGQPISVALQLCLVQLLNSWNIVPSAVVSHSSGEIAAAYAAGMITFKEALGIAYYRGQLALKYQKLTSQSGGMLAAKLSVEEVEEYIDGISDGKVVVACVNSPISVTLSGDLPALENLASRLEEDGVFARRLKVPMAYHSHHMQHMAQEYEDILRSILPATGRSARTLFASPVTGDIITAPEALGPEHWVRNLTSPVLFSQSLEEMVFSPKTSNESSRPSTQATNVDILLEIGPHDTLSGPVRQILGEKMLPYTSCLRRSVNAVDTMHDVACELLVRGYPVLLREVNSIPGHEPRYVHDLPSYAWNHKTSYEVEPRASREHRYKRFTPHELLGSPIAGANKLTPTWRNILRVQDISWLTDHQLESKVVFPGAGYISMAIEAVRLLTKSSAAEDSISGYRLRDVAIMNALIIPSSSTGVETVFSLRACSEKELDHKDWYEFELYSVGVDDSWIQHCKGYVSAEMNTRKSKATAELSTPCEDTFLTPGVRVNYVEPESTFSALRKMDFYHGPTFQNLIGSRVAENKAITRFSISQTALKIDEALGIDIDYVLHPTTLDSIFQSCYVCLPSEAKEGAMLVPRSIGSMYVPRRLAGHNGHELLAFMDLVKWNRRDAAFNGYVVPCADGDECAIQLRDFHLQRIRQVEADDAKTTMSRVHAKSRWEMDILHAIPAAVKEPMKIWLDGAEICFEKRLREASYHLIFQAVNQLENQSTEGWQWYHKRFYNWMTTIVESGETGKLAPGSETWSKTSNASKERLFDDLVAENAAGELTCKVGWQLANIIRGDITPLELMMEGGLLHKFYKELPRLKTRSFKHLRQIIELYAVKTPGARVLEIGGGTGGATTDVLEAFAARAEGGPGSLLGQYDFTDVSPGFFPAAKEKFAAWESLMSFAKLDIEIDPVQQGFTSNSYDLIIAAQVLHATKSLKRTLAHVRKLLKPGGKLVLLEGTQDGLDIQLIFGTLPGWWLSEEPERKMSPNVNVKAWDQVLKATGFSGIDFEIGDCEQPEVQFTSVLVTTAEAPPSYPSSVTIVCDQRTAGSWVDEIAKAIRAETGSTTSTTSLEHFQPTEDQVCVVALEMVTSFVDTMDRAAFEKIRGLLVDSPNILWLSCGSAIDAKEPLWAQTQGLLRTLRREDLNKRCVLLDFESTSESWTTDAINHIVHVFQESFNYNISGSGMDWEYAVKDSILHVPRVYPDVKQDRACMETNPTPELKPFHEPGRDLVWEIAEGGLLDNLYFAEKLRTAEDVPSGMVEIESKVFGLNFQDLMTAMSLLKETAFVGHESAGTITRLGPGTEQSGLQIGDRVCGVFKGRFASTSQAYWTSVTKIPDDMSFEEAVSIPYAYGTAYIGLYDIGRLEKGERVLIHSAAGGVGQAALMLAQHTGAEVFVTCGTESKHAFLMDRYKVPSDHIFSSRDPSFAPAIMAKTGGQGVDVVLNSLAGPLLEATWDCMARFGRFVEIGKVDIEAARRLNMSPFGRGVTMAGIDLIQYSEYKGNTVQNALANSVRLCNTQQSRPVHPITSYSISDMNKAMRHMQTGVHMGKLVLVPRVDDKVKVLSWIPPLSLDSADSTYLISGGLGGIGHAIAVWMMEKGAKNLLVVSRKAASHPKALTLLQTAKTFGCKMCVRNCDVSEEKGFLELLADSASMLPPIRGVIQAAMVLDDAVLERMTHDQWLRAIRPKVAGTMNLHKHLPNLNFFIMLSSATGILGNVSQANYTAGNTFQDALARHRTANDLPAVSIDLGQVADAGHVAEGGDRVRQRLAKAFTTTILPMDHVLRLIEMAIREPLRKHPHDSQIITCVAQYESLAEDQAASNDKRFGTLRLGNAGIVVSRGEPVAISRVEELVLELETKSITDSETSGLVGALLAAKVGELFNIAASEIDLGLTLPHHGVDSLVAVQFRNWLSSVVKARVSIFEILQAPSLTDFAALVMGRSSLLAKAS